MPMRGYNFPLIESIAVDSNHRCFPLLEDLEKDQMTRKFMSTFWINFVWTFLDALWKVRQKDIRKIHMLMCHVAVLIFVQTLYVDHSKYNITMLQKLSKCGVKAWLFLKYNFTTTQNLREIKFWRIQTVQTCHFWQF